MAKKPSLNVVIPVYNEEIELAQSIHTLTDFLDKQLSDFEWVVTIADNASKDNTLKIAKELAHENRRVSVAHLPRKGRGRAVKQVWRESGTDIVAYMDVDLSTDLKHFPPLVRSLTHGYYDVAIGTRNAGSSKVTKREMMRTITSKGYISLIKFFFWVHFSDAQCGFKAVTRKIVEEILPKVRDDEWFFDTELLLIAEKEGYHIYEEPVTWVDNPGSTVRVMKTAQGDLEGLFRMFITRPWLKKKSLP